MSENNAAKPVNKAEKTPAAKAPKGDVVSARESATKTVKVIWTLDRCKKYARRFATEAVWASAASASYKAAVAHGWKDECVAQMGRPVQANFKKAA